MDGIEPKQRQQATGMMTKPDAIFHEDVLSHEPREWQHQQVGSHGRS
jgi:hypothetical protein